MHTRPLSGDDLPALSALVAACLAHDGGLPMAADEPLLRALYLDGSALGWFDGPSLLAAAGVVPDASGGVVGAGCVHPAARGRGVGRSVLARTVEDAAGRPLVIRSESVTEPAERLLRRAGFGPVMGERLLRHDLRGVDVAPLPAETELRPWTEASAAAFFAAWSAAFADRPGFPGWTQDRWVSWTADDEDFSPDHSVVATVADEPVGFVTVADGWIVQAGVVPAWRRRGLAAALVTRALAALRADGAAQCLLAVGTDNPGAEALYRRLGFRDAGRRGRYARV